METRDYKAILSDIESRIGNARLMAVSKTRTIEEIMSVYDAGCRLFGENHVQEIVAKFPAKPADIELHMIGHLQSNKVNKVVPLVDMIESVDSVSLLSKINAAAERACKIMDVLLEVNTSKEEAKSGFLSKEDVFACLEASLLMKNVRIRGLMTVGPVDCDPAKKDELTDEALALLTAYRNNNLMPLAEHINAFVDRLNKAGIKNHLPYYTLGLLPPIDPSK